jgi:hypothetical protein
MSKQNSIKGGNIQTSSFSGKFFTELSNNELRELMSKKDMEDIYFLISEYNLDGFDLSLLKYVELNIDLKIKNMHQRNRLIKFINRELTNQCNL